MQLKRSLLLSLLCWVLFGSASHAQQTIVSACPFTATAGTYTVEVIGAGGGGAVGNSTAGGQAGGGGGAGAYASSTGVVLSSGSISCQIGVGGSGTTALPTLGTDTIFNSAAATC